MAKTGAAGWLHGQREWLAWPRERPSKPRTGHQHGDISELAGNQRGWQKGHSPSSQASKVQRGLFGCHRSAMRGGRVLELQRRAAQTASAEACESVPLWLSRAGVLWLLRAARHRKRRGHWTCFRHEGALRICECILRNTREGPLRPGQARPSSQRPLRIYAVSYRTTALSLEGPGGLNPGAPSPSTPIRARSPACPVARCPACHLCDRNVAGARTQ